MKNLVVFAVLLGVLGLSACAGRPTLIETDPPEAAITVDGKDVGTSPCSYSFSTSGLRFSYEVRATKDGYAPGVQVVASHTNLWGSVQWPDRVQINLKKSEKSEKSEKGKAKDAP